jgi:hypothetical protein
MQKDGLVFACVQRPVHTVLHVWKKSRKLEIVSTVTLTLTTLSRTKYPELISFYSDYRSLCCLYDVSYDPPVQ